MLFGVSLPTVGVSFLSLAHQKTGPAQSVPTLATQLSHAQVCDNGKFPILKRDQRKCVRGGACAINKICKGMRGLNIACGLTIFLSAESKQLLHLCVNIEAQSLFSYVSSGIQSHCVVSLSKHTHSWTEIFILTKLLSTLPSVHRVHCMPSMLQLPRELWLK